MRIDRLTTLTLLYLLLPVWLFLLGWVQLPTALPLCLLTAVAGYRYVRKPNVATSPEVPLHRYEIAILLLASLFFTWVSGIGAFTVQLTDYGKHNQIFVDLITRNWPIIYQNPRYNDPFLCYYVAYYLPTAALTKLLHLPLRCADWLSAGWGWAGLWLSLRWAMRLSGPYRVWIGAGLLLLAGIEIPYRLGPWLWVENGGDWSAWWDALWHGPIFRYSRYVPPRYFFSGGQWQHSLSAAPLFDQLQQAPQHAFPGWLGASLLLHRQRSGRAVASLWLVSSVLLL